MKASDLITITLEEVIKYNENYKPDGSESRPFDIENMKKFITEIRPMCIYTEDTSGSGWKALSIKTSHSKYGTNYVYYNLERKLWRTSQTIGEFYGGSVVD